MRAAVYTRISNDPRLQGLGVERQLEDLLTLADQRGYTVVARFDDNDISAFSGKTRPGFEALLKAMAAREFDVLLAWHPDRLCRSMRDLERLIETADAGKVAIHTVQGGDLDLATSAGRMVARILGSVARQESEHTSERRVRANRQKAEQGRWQTANRPFGYTMDGKPFEPEASAYRQAVTDVLAGKSIKQVAREWNTAGLKTTLAGRKQTYNGSRFTVTGRWAAPRVRRLLVNPRYAGLKTYRGKVIGPGDWEPLIDVDTHRGLVAFLTDPSRIITTSFEKKHMGSGVYQCGVCGSALRHAVSGGRNTGQRKYECRQSNSHVVVSGPPLDAYVETIVLGWLSRPETRQRLTAMLDGRPADIDSLHARRAALQARLDELAALFAAGDIDGSQLRRGTTDLRAQLAGVDKVLADLVRKNPAADLAAAGDRIREHWGRLAPDLKGKVVSEICTIVVDKATRKGRGFDPGRVRVEWL
ncbi:recombinase family protein [Mycobacterium shinjukuense]|uniref:Serine recombinase n=1 Tax=Mycobacterium shinjukuense TaxID=398694 RepID=A0A7I7MJ76_9MYCO|nr:recombinase family protein [Mycobacterium shinjukuense]MCV6987084.1 recombinase family protein [Mycobacterium shinjukuense]ORB61634.1 serine recombinase [Mycobacterium shinjukuense]BBX72206.1 serine recombinase [Mycobacterium shinjukuense]